jgi:nucleotide-binding universal stress UspA family protein
MYKRARLPLDGSMVAVAVDHHWRRPHNDPEHACPLHVRTGDGVAGILAGAPDVEVDLIAMTRHGREGWAAISNATRPTPTKVGADGGNPEDPAPH